MPDYREAPDAVPLHVSIWLFSFFLQRTTMPKSTISIIEDMARANKSAPTRFDLYDIQRSIDDIDVPSFDDMEHNISELSNEVDTLSKSVNGLKDVVDKLHGAMATLANVMDSLGDAVKHLTANLPNQYTIG
jgi:methyl-accepting chemotaxis protein